MSRGRNADEARRGWREGGRKGRKEDRWAVFGRQVEGKEQGGGREEGRKEWIKGRAAAGKVLDEVNTCRRVADEVTARREVRWDEQLHYGSTKNTIIFHPS